MADDDITAAPAYDETAAPASEAFGATALERRKSGKAIAALVCGILSLVAPFGIVLGIVAIALGTVARKEIRADAGIDGDAMALAGMITGALGSIVFVVYVAVAAASGG